MRNLTDNKIFNEVNTFNVLGIINITEASYILRFTRNGLEFKPGQHIVVGFNESQEAREYSIYSGIHDDYLEILVREVENGSFSHLLRNVKHGDELKISGPFGFFMYNCVPPEFKKFLFVASGTGIAPFHSFVRSYPNSDYRIVHGIRKITESYGVNDYRDGTYIPCTSGDMMGEYHGRLTEYLKSAEIREDELIYFCGNNNMITDAMNILKERNFSHSQMFTEVYF